LPFLRSFVEIAKQNFCDELGFLLQVHK